MWSIVSLSRSYLIRLAYWHQYSEFTSSKPVEVDDSDIAQPECKNWCLGTLVCALVNINADTTKCYLSRVGFLSVGPYSIMTVDVVLKAVLVRPEYRHEAFRAPVRPETKCAVFEKYWRKSRFALFPRPSSDIRTTHVELVTSTCACGHRGHKTEACVGKLSRFFLSSLGPCHIQVLAS